jgi:alkylglycerol monooxygenase
VFYLEFARGVLLSLCAFYYFPDSATLAYVLAGTLLTMLYFSTLQKQYLQWIYGH